jgi:hypothetical protein
MISETSRFEIGKRRGALVALLLVSACQAPRGAAPARGNSGCRDVITSAGARRIFEQVSAIRAGDGCVLAGVSTQLSVMRITWTRNGAALQDFVLVTPTACAPRGSTTVGSYAFQRSEGFATQCPATFAALTMTFSRAAPPPTSASGTTTQSRSRSWSRAWVFGSLGALALAALAAFRWWRRRAPGVKPAALP